MSGMDIGAMDRVIRFERGPGETTDPLDAGETAWMLVAEVWASVQDMLPSRSEKSIEGLSMAKRPARVRIYYRDDLTSAMRIVHGARVMSIIAGPAEIGRRAGLEFIAQDYSTAGGGE